MAEAPACRAMERNSTVAAGRWPETAGVSTTRSTRFEPSSRWRSPGAT